MQNSGDFEFTQNLRTATTNCDVAFIYVPTHLHNQTINKILKFTKCHFYIEKPLSSEIKNCLNTLKKIKKTKKKGGCWIHACKSSNHPQNTIFIKTKSYRRH